MNIFPADKVEPGSTISTTSSSLVLFIIHRLTLKFPHLNCRIVSYKVDQNIIYSLNNQRQIRSGIKELTHDCCAFVSTVLDAVHANAQDTKQQEAKT